MDLEIKAVCIEKTFSPIAPEASEFEALLHNSEGKR
jgi:hypothetical protein